MIILNKSNHPFFLFTPEFVVHVFQTFPEGHRGDVFVEEGIVRRALFQVVVWNFGIQVVDVVEPDIARKPLHDAGQFVVSAAFYRRKYVFPLVFPLFIGAFVLVLHVKKPHGDDAEQEDDAQLDEQESLED